MKNYFSSSLLKRIVRLSSLSFAVGAFSYSNISYADIEGIPYNQEFPNAQHPYAQAPDGCSGWQNARQVRDTWGSVNFIGACDNHDRCYYTVGSDWNTCNERFYSDLRAACESDLRVWVPPVTVGGVTITPGFHTPPEPASLGACYAVASGYYGGVQAGVLLDVFDEAQDKQRRYEEWVASVRNPSPNRRPAEETAYYTQQIGEHCHWYLNNQERSDYWRLIQTAAQRDAGNTDSEYYRKRIADHCEWYLNNQGRTDWWNLIESAARQDAGL
jgi:hypothetical protein